MNLPLRQDYAPALAVARSFLFAPGDDVHKLTKAFASGADAVVVDLEDAVLPEKKQQARTCATESLANRQSAPACVVRINSLETIWGRDDLDALRGTNVDGIMVPKATPRSLLAIPEFDIPLIAIIETASGLLNAQEVARDPRVVMLALGSADLGAELRWIARPDGLELLMARSTLVLVSTALGLRTPLDVVWLDTRDQAGLRSEAQTARTLGMGGKLCIHPSQIDPVNDVFTPDQAEVDHALKVVAAARAAVQAGGSGVAVLDGQMIDAPVIKNARAVLALAGKISPQLAEDSATSWTDARGLSPDLNN